MPRFFKQRPILSAILAAMAGAFVTAFATPRTDDRVVDYITAEDLNRVVEAVKEKLSSREEEIAGKELELEPEPQRWRLFGRLRN
jgi:hypothetical protein